MLTLNLIQTRTLSWCFALLHWILNNWFNAYITISLCQGTQNNNRIQIKKCCSSANRASGSGFNSCSGQTFFTHCLLFIQYG